MKCFLNLFFLLLVPLCEGYTVQLSMPSYFSMNSPETLDVECNFDNADKLLDISLLHGGTETVARYTSNGRKYQLDINTFKISLKTNWISMTAASVTFTISWVSCSDFTWYVCRGYGLNKTVDSEKKTLKVLPTVNSIIKTSTSHITVNRMSTFMCRGTISNEGRYSVKWYRSFIAPSNEIYFAENKIFCQNQCSRKIESVVASDVTDDFPITLWCQIENGKSAHLAESFLVQGAGCEFKQTIILVVMVSFLASAFHHF